MYHLKTANLHFSLSLLMCLLQKSTSSLFCTTVHPLMTFISFQKWPNVPISIPSYMQSKFIPTPNKHTPCQPQEIPRAYPCHTYCKPQELKNCIPCTFIRHWIVSIYLKTRQKSLQNNCGPMFLKHQVAFLAGKSKLVGEQQLYLVIC